MLVRKNICHSWPTLFASTTEFINAFQFKGDVKEVEIDFTQAHVWDGSAVAAVDKVVMKYEQNGVKVKITGLNERSSELVIKLAKQAVR